LTIDFKTYFEEIDKDNTKMSVKSESDTIDSRKAKGKIKNIVK
jgi:hypothetical protein